MRSILLGLSIVFVVFSVHGELTLGTGEAPMKKVRSRDCRPQSGLNLSLDCVPVEGPRVSTYHASYASLQKVPVALRPYLSSDARQASNPFEKSKDGAVDVILICDNDNPACGMLFGSLNALGVDGSKTEKYNGDDHDFTVALQASAGKFHNGRYYSVMYLTEAYTREMRSPLPGAEIVKPGFVPIPQFGSKQQAPPEGSQEFRVRTLLGIFAEQNINNVDVEAGVGLEQVDGKSGRGLNAGGVQEVFHEVTNALADFDRPNVHRVASDYGRRTSVFLSLKASIKRRLKTRFGKSENRDVVSQASPLQGRASIKLHYTGPAIDGGQRVQGASHIQSVLGLDYDWLAQSSRRASYRLSGELDGRLFEDGAQELNVNGYLSRAKGSGVLTLGVSKPLINDETQHLKFDVQKEPIYRLGYQWRLFTPPRSR